MTISETQEILSQSVADTHALAGRVAAALKPGAVLALHGELGSGKTCFVQGLARALGVTQAVQSPTYTLVNEYAGSLPLYHVDLYRIRDGQDALNLGLDEYLYGEGITAIEWAERAADIMPPAAWHIRFVAGQNENERRITIARGNAS